MNCRNYRTDILLYAGGELDREKSQALEMHMKECGECRAFMNYVEESFNLIQLERNAEPNPFLATRILNEMEKRSQPVPSVKRWIPAFAFVILLIAAVIGGINLGKLYSQTIFSNSNKLQEEMSYFDDLEQEQIETFFMTSNETGNE